MPLVLALIFLFTLIFLANIATASPDKSLANMLNWALLGLNLLIFLLGLGLLLVRPGDLAAAGMETGLTDFRPAGSTFLGIAIWGVLATLPELRRWLARWLPIDPESAVHTLALVLCGFLLGNSLISLSQGGLESLAETASATSIWEVIASEALFALTAIAGVGIFIRRSGYKTLERLGLTRPTGKQLLRGLGWVLVLVVLQALAGAIWLALNPEQAELLDSVNSSLLGDIDTVWEWFLLALAAALGEEMLFRGALQPIFGLWATSLLFAVAHVNYGVTPATAVVFVIGLVLGIIRQRSSTSVSIFVHFNYNFLLGLLALLAPYLEQLATPPG